MRVVTQIHRPELTGEERAKRMDEIKQAAVRLVLATERSRARQNERK